MKKTKKTVMTAALFAAAMNLVPSGAVEAVVSNDDMGTVFAADEPDSESVVGEVENDFQGVYGPPWMMLPESQWRGDVYEDGVIDAYDMVELRKKLLNGTESDWDAKRADVNGDGEVGISDMVMLQKYLMGQIDGFTEKAETQTTESTSGIKTEIVTTTKTVPVPVYGPPSMFD
ncbi:MAG: dockerin type I repeat-containing protein [Ruminococcus sp.]|nr:dockerin type I repeat-containing protein [Ruminococcus sp.]